MRTYSQHDEDNIRDQALVEDWIGSGLLNPEQDQNLQAGLAVALRRTNNVLRAVLALFTGLIAFASVVLTTDVLHVGRTAGSLVYGIWAAICLGLARLLAQKGRLYRCGVEEALAAASVVLVVASISLESSGSLQGLIGMTCGAMGCLAIYALFRFRYALAIAVVLAGLAPFTLSFFDAVAERILSLLVFVLIFFVARLIQAPSRGDTAEADGLIARTAAFAGFYLTLNLMITARTTGPGSITSGWFYWFTYVMVWIVPVAGLWLGIRERARFMMDVSGIALLLTIITNKTYLGWERQAWDPIVLGVLLIVVAMAVRRWLAKEPGGFTPLRLLESENRGVSAAGALSLALPQTPGPSAAEPSSMKTGGGQSGGGGASGSF